MIVIDGSQGEGGGQIFRTSLTLAMCLGKAVKIENIRSGRSKPGLLRQHLTCLNAAQSICDAEVSGNSLGSQDVSFKPGKVKAGRYRFAVGSAGSTSLVFQTIFLPLAMSDGKSELYLEGGTHNGMAPSFDFIESCFLPAIKQVGFQADVQLERYGFYPAGGGAWTAKIVPAVELRRLDLKQRGKVIGQKAVAMSSRLPAHVTERELAHIKRKCIWPESALEQRLVESVGPGNMLSLRLQCDNVTELVECVGEKSLKAERVAGLAVKALKTYMESEAAVGEYLSDQLLLPMVLGKGGGFTMQFPSQHFMTNVDVVRKFIDTKISVIERNKCLYEVLVG